MASIDKRSDGRYRARWREFPGGPQKTRHFDRRLEAQRFLDTVRGDLARGVYIDAAGGRTLFREYAEQWRAAQVHRPSTAQQAETYLRVHAYPTLGHRPLGMIRRSEIQAWVKDRSASCPPARSRSSTGGWRRSSGRRSAIASSPPCPVIASAFQSGSAKRWSPSPSRPSRRWSTPCPTGTNPSSCSPPAPVCARASASG